MSSRIEQIIEEIEEYIDRDCKYQPLSTTKIIVNKEHLDELLRELGDVFQDAKLLQQASEAASLLIEQDPGLKWEEHQSLRMALEHLISKRSLETTL